VVFLKKWVYYNKKRDVTFFRKCYIPVLIIISDEVEISLELFLYILKKFLSQFFIINPNS